MYKWLILLILINFSCDLFAKWQENQLSLETSYQASSLNQSDLYQESSTIHQLELAAQKVTLLDGIGVNLKGSVSPYFIEQEDLSKETGTNYSVLTEGVLFLSATSELALKYDNTKKLEYFDSRLDNLLLNLPEELSSERQIGEINFTLGQDKSFFFLDFQHQSSQIKKETFLLNTLVQELDNNTSSADLLWRQSESTLWGTRVELIKSEREIRSQVQNFDVKNYYLSNLTEYFGSSQLSVNVGRSEVEGAAQFSWDIKHKTYLSEQTNFSLRSYRKFDQAINDSELEDLNTRYEAAVSYQPLDYVKTNLSFYREQRKQGSIKTFDRKSLKFELSVDYKESWSLTAAYASESATDHITNRNWDQSKVQLTISRAFV